MALTNFVPFQTTVTAAWLTNVDQMVQTGLGGTPTVPAVLAWLGLSSATGITTVPVPVNEGGTGSNTAAGGLANLGGTTLAAVNQAYIAGQLQLATAAEIAAASMFGVTLNLAYPYGSPLRFGALGVGGDDTKALNACFSVASVVNFPGPGYTFGISSNLSYSIGNGVINGNGSVIQPLASYVPSTVTGVANCMANINVSSANDVVIRNLIFNCALYSGASGQNYGILFQGTAGGLTTGGVVEDCTFIDYPDPVGSCIGFWLGGFEHRAFGNRSLQCHGTVFAQSARTIIESNVAENPADTSFTLQGSTNIGSSIINNKIYNPSSNAQNSIGVEEGPSDWVITGNYVEGVTGAAIYMYNNLYTTQVRGGVIAENIIDGAGASNTTTGIVYGILMTQYYTDCDIHDNIIKNLSPTASSASSLALLYQTNSKFHDNDLDATSAVQIVTAVSINPAATAGTLDIIDNRLNNTGGGRGYMLQAGAFGSQRILWQGGEIIGGSVGIDANFTSNSGADIQIKDMVRNTAATALNVGTNYPVLADFQTAFNTGSAFNFPHWMKTLAQTVMFGTGMSGGGGAPGNATGVQGSFVWNSAVGATGILGWVKTASNAWTAIQMP